MSENAEQITTELEDLRDSTQSALDSIEGAVGYIDYGNEDGSWSSEDRAAAEAAIQSARSSLNGPQSPQDIIALFSRLESEVQAIPVESLESA